MGQERTLSLVIPAKDEEANIATLLTEAYGVMRDYHGFEVVLVDDGSTDSTLDTAVRTEQATYRSFMPSPRALPLRTAPPALWAGTPSISCGLP